MPSIRVWPFWISSGSKLPSYILPMFPALALVLGFELTRLSARALAWIALPLAVGAPALLLAYVVGYDRLVAALATDQTRSFSGPFEGSTAPTSAPAARSWSMATTFLSAASP